MPRRLLMLPLVFLLAADPGRAETPPRWWPEEVEQALERAGGNRGELEKALHQSPAPQRRGMAFLIEHMPAADLAALTADFLLANTDLAYRARRELPWGAAIPEEIFLNDVLPYANVDEKRDAWRAEFFEMCRPLVRDCKTPAEAAQKLNAELFARLKLGYSTQRKAPNQSPQESIEQGKASCTGLSIVLADACRAVCVPARLVGTPLWANKRGNHTWVEIWDRDWHFTGACEHDPAGLNRGWFVGDAAQALKDSPLHAIYAASYRRTGQHFPLVWARNNKDVPAVNVTDRYAKNAASPADAVRVMVRVTDAAKKRVAKPVAVASPADETFKMDGVSRGESADTNDFLTFDLKPHTAYVIKAGGVEKSIKTGAAGTQKLVELAVE